MMFRIFPWIMLGLTAYAHSWWAWVWVVICLLAELPDVIVRVARVWYRHKFTNEWLDKR